jgi:hypothetical protein
MDQDKATRALPLMTGALALGAAQGSDLQARLVKPIQELE